MWFPRFFERFLFPSLGLALVLLPTSPAGAQGVSLAQVPLERENPREVNPFWINYQDCIENEPLRFNLNVVDFSGLTLETWVGTNCTERNARIGDAASCHRVSSFNPVQSSTLVEVLPQDVVAPNGTAADCESDLGEVNSVDRTFWFMLLDGQQQVLAHTTWEDTNVDLLGPPPPTEIEARAGERRLSVSWTVNETNSNEHRGYRIYCDPPPGSTTPGAAVDAGTSPSADAAVGGEGGSGPGDADAGGGIGGTGTGGTGTGGTGTGGTGTAGSSSATGGGTSSGCSSAVLIPGERPPEGYLCGSVTGQITNEASASGLINGIPYAVAVASFDAAENVGLLSALACETPVEVDDFFEIYRRSGGQGGGGLCGVTSGSAPGFAGLILAAGALFGLRRVQNRRRNAQK